MYLSEKNRWGSRISIWVEMSTFPTQHWLNPFLCILFLYYIIQFCSYYGDGMAEFSYIDVTFKSVQMLSPEESRKENTPAYRLPSGRLSAKLKLDFSFKMGKRCYVKCCSFKVFSSVIDPLVSTINKQLMSYLLQIA